SAYRKAAISPSARYCRNDSRMVQTVLAECVARFQRASGTGTLETCHTVAQTALAGSASSTRMTTSAGAGSRGAGGLKRRSWAKNHGRHRKYTSTAQVPVNQKICASKSSRIDRSASARGATGWWYLTNPFMAAYALANWS